MKKTDWAQRQAEKFYPGHIIGAQEIRIIQWSSGKSFDFKKWHLSQLQAAERRGYKAGFKEAGSNGFRLACNHERIVIDQNAVFLKKKGGKP